MDGILHAAFIKTDPFSLHFPCTQINFLLAPDTPRTGNFMTIKINQTI